MSEIKTMNMNFHGGGFVSKEEENVMYESDNVIVLGESDWLMTDDDYEELDKEEHELETGESYWIFDKINGGCVNDCTYFGCHRTIDVK